MCMHVYVHYSYILHVYMCLACGIAPLLELFVCVSELVNVRVCV